MTAPNARHPEGDTLMAFAAGTLGEALSAVVAAHVGACPACRREVRLLSGLGGGLLESLGGEALPQPPNLPSPADAAGIPSRADPADPMPAIIQHRYGLKLADVPWKTMGPGLWFHWLPLSEGTPGELRLLRVAAGRRIPEHAHAGSELTFVIEGGFHDVTGSYAAGDVQDVDGDIEHTPTADAEGCICLVAAEAPAAFKGLLGRLVQPLTRR